MRKLLFCTLLFFQFQLSKAQMEAPKPATVPAGPTAVEMTDQRLIDARRKGRRANVLTGVTGPADTLSLGYRSLLG
jgi:hypothetical protein